ncbi:hypothetical protein L5515_017421 [Caenorhabditis briggsae]|uniref:Uncharacterized protein n=1 Tax=Caenorhabditis briggsae TaxID=6238 RepID=A0AAE9FGT9_CAEBR|nr:hypothetical protein L5515_017421 [Caenorhabditis briggsae]
MVDRNPDGAASPERISITSKKNTLRDEKTNCDSCQIHPERLDGQIREISILAIFLLVTRKAKELIRNVENRQENQ